MVNSVTQVETDQFTPMHNATDTGFGGFIIFVGSFAKYKPGPYLINRAKVGKVWLKLALTLNTYVTQLTNFSWVTWLPLSYAHSRFTDIKTIQLTSVLEWEPYNNWLNIHTLRCNVLVWNQYVNVGQTLWCLDKSKRPGLCILNVESFTLTVIVFVHAGPCF